MEATSRGGEEGAGDAGSSVEGRRAICADPSYRGRAREYLAASAGGTKRPPT
jgi:hypothetical protein